MCAASTYLFQIIDNIYPIYSLIVIFHEKHLFPVSCMLLEELRLSCYSPKLINRIKLFKYLHLNRSCVAAFFGLLELLCTRIKTLT